MKIAICEFRQESNAFNPIPADFGFFELGGIHEGQVFHDALYGKQVAVGGMLVSMHGATQSESIEDVCGFILEALREQVGPDTLISPMVTSMSGPTERTIFSGRHPGRGQSPIMKNTTRRIPS